MNDKLVSFELARLAKEKGFDYLCFAYAVPLKDWMVGNAQHDKFGNGFYIKTLANPFGDYNIQSRWTIRNSDFVSSKDKFTLPTQSLLQRWLREEHGLHADISQPCDAPLKWMWNIFPLGKAAALGSTQDDYTTYEEALEHGLQAALKLI